MRKTHAGSAFKTLLPCLLNTALLSCGGGSSIPAAGTGGAAPSSSEFLFVTAQNQILGFTVDPSSGGLSNPTTIPGPSVTGGPTVTPSLGIASAGKLGFLYVSDSQNNQIDGFAVNNSSGVLTPIAGSPFPMPNPFGAPGVTGGVPGNMVADPPQGNFLYVDNGAIEIFAINPMTGQLTTVSGPPLSPNLVGLEIAISPSENFLYQFGDGVSGYAIDSATGALTLVAGSPFALPVKGFTSSLVVDSSGQFLYDVVTSLPLNNNSTSSVAGYSIDQSTGAVSMLSGSPSFTGTTLASAIVTFGSFLYVGSSQGILGFNIASTTGALTEMTGSPFAAGSDFGGMAISPNGRFLYETGANAINVFAIDPTSGSLSLTGNAPASGRPLALAFCSH